MDVIPHLRVRSRWSSAVGSITTFEPAEPIAGADRPLGLTRSIEIPSLERGLDAILFFENAKATSLEIVTSGGEPWNSLYDGFSIPPDA